MKVAIITGGNGAVGQGIAQRLLEANTAITIILACRSIDRGSEAKTQILTKVHHSNTKLKDIHVMKLDLSSTTGVSRFCSEFKQSYDRLDYLYLNAGVLPIESTDLKTGLYNIITNPSYVAKTGGDILVQQRGQLTPQGYGSVFASNTLGHYMLVKLLEPELITAAPSLIVWVTSTTAIRQFYSNKDYQCIRG